MRRLPDFWRDERGVETIEFIVVFIAFISIVFFVIEITLFQFFGASLEKAAQAGARAAAVSPIAASATFPARIPYNGTGVRGAKCSVSPSPCGAVAAVTCYGVTSGSCNATSFNRILAHMRGYNGNIQAANVVIRYEHVGLGYATGPTVPMVTVYVACVPYQTGIFGLLLRNISAATCNTTLLPNSPGPGSLRYLPPRKATMTGEDLAL